MKPTADADTKDTGSPHHLPHQPGHAPLTASQIISPMIADHHEVDDVLLLMVATTISRITDNGVPSDVSDYGSSTMTAVPSLTDSNRTDVKSDSTQKKHLFDSNVNFNAGSSKES